eukprot:6203556-Pleurochrysis_carterae.AAC.1
MEPWARLRVGRCGRHTSSTHLAGQQPDCSAARAGMGSGHVIIARAVSRAVTGYACLSMQNCFAFARYVKVVSGAPAGIGHNITHLAVYEQVYFLRVIPRWCASSLEAAQLTLSFVRLIKGRAYSAYMLDCFEPGEH